MREQIKAADRTRFRALQDLGCICCLPRGFREAAIHHIVESNRLGHQFTLPLCGWCHQGITPSEMTYHQAIKEIGPHFHGMKSAFVARYGTERELLAKVDELIGETPCGLA